MGVEKEEGRVGKRNRNRGRREGGEDEGGREAEKGRERKRVAR